MKCTLIGMGCGARQLTAEASEAIHTAQLLIGAKRLLELLPDTGAQKIPEYRPQKIVSLLHAHPAEECCVLYSGDSGFYSGAAGLFSVAGGHGGAGIARNFQSAGVCRSTGGTMAGMEPPLCPWRGL